MTDLSTAVTWSRQPEAYDLLWGGFPLLEGLRPEAVLTDGSRLAPGLNGLLRLDVELGAVQVGLGRGMTQAATVSLSLTRSATIEAAEAPGATPRLAVFTLLSAKLDKPGRILRSGWQSWSYAGSLPVTRTDPDLFDDQSRPRHGHPRGANGTLWSDWWTVIERVGPGPNRPWLALGFVTGRDQFGDFAFAPESGGVRLEARSLGDGRPLAPGETVRSETLAIIAGEGNPWPALEALAAEAGERAAPACASVPSPTGWCTWYHYFHGISEETVLEDLARRAELGRRLPLEVFQIDDGYQKGIGNWLETNDKFPRGMKWLAERIREAGVALEPGIWLAPFSVMPGTPAFAEHPDWVLRDAAGEPVPAGINWGGPFYGLDVTHPEVEEHLRHLFRTVVRDWGYRYLKLDFIYCASLPGLRHDPRVNRAGALRRGLKVVREAVPEAYILGCGSPLLPAVGLVHAMRIGPDVAPFWAAPPPLDADPSFPSAVNSLRNVFARAFLHGRTWANDPDCLLVRDTETMLSPDEVRTLATGLACSGSALVLSDALGSLTDERLDLVQRVLPPSERPAVPVDPLGEAQPSAVVVPPVETAPARGERTYTVALFNWSDEAEAGRRVVVPSLLRQAGFEPPSDPDHQDTETQDGPPRPHGELAWHVFDFWARRYLGRFTEDVAVVTLPELPPHGSAVLGLVEHRHNAPMVVGSDRHLVQGPPLVSDERVAEAGARTGMLRVRIAPGGMERARVWVAMPVTCRIQRVEPPLKPVQAETKVWGEILTYEVPLDESGFEFAVHFERSEVSWTKSHL